MNHLSRRKAFWAGFALFMAAFFWGVSFLFQRKAMDYMTPMAYIGLRFTLGALLLLPFAGARLRRALLEAERPREIVRRNLRWCLAAGAIMCVGSAFQQYGLLWTTVAKAGFITSLYVVLVPFLMFLFGRKIATGETVGAVLAVAGLFLLSVTDSFSLSAGDVLVLIGAVAWAAHVIYIGKVSPRMDSFVLGTGQALVCGLIGLAYLLLRGEMPSGAALAEAWPLVVCGGLSSVTLGFTLQIVGQKDANPAAAVIIMQLEAVFAALAAWVYLDEGMSLRMLVGAGIILAGVLVSQLWPFFLESTNSGAA